MLQKYNVVLFTCGTSVTTMYSLGNCNKQHGMTGVLDDFSPESLLWYGLDVFALVYGAQM